MFFSAYINLAREENVKFFKFISSPNNVRVYITGYIKLYTPRRCELRIYIRFGFYVSINFNQIVLCPSVWLASWGTQKLSKRIFPSAIDSVCWCYMSSRTISQISSHMKSIVISMISFSKKYGTMAHSVMIPPQHWSNIEEVLVQSLMSAIWKEVHRRIKGHHLITQKNM